MRIHAEIFQMTRRQLEQHLWLRWLAANVVGWSVGLLAGGLAAQVIARIGGGAVGAIGGLLLAGAVTGAVIGRAQRWALRGLLDPPELEQRWLRLSVMGSMLGASSLLLTWYVLLLGDIGYALIGAIFGLCFGWAQASPLGRYWGTFAAVWVIVNVLGGCVCSYVTLQGLPWALPIFCAPGPLLFGGITGAALLVRARRDQASVDHHQ